MMPLFCSLHAIAAERGDGLHPQLLRAMRYSIPEPHVASPQILVVSPEEVFEPGLPVKAR